MKRDALIARAAQTKASDFKTFIRDLDKLTHPRKEAEVPWILPESAAWFEQHNLPYRILETPALDE